MHEAIVKQFVEPLSWELVERIDQNLAYKSRVDNSSLYAIGYLFATLIIGAWLSSFSDLTGGLTLVALLVGEAILFYFYRGWNRRLLEYTVDSNEWAKYYSHQIILSIDSVLETKVPTQKRKNKREALGYTKKLVNALEQYWTIGGFKPIRDLVGNSIDSLKSNINGRVLAALRENNENDQLLETIRLPLLHLNQFCDNLSIDHLKIVNDEFKDIPLKITKGPPSILKSLTQINKQRTNLLSISILGFVCILVGTRLVYVNFSKEASLAASVALFGILVTAYLRLKGKD